LALVLGPSSKLVLSVEALSDGRCVPVFKRF